MNPIFFSWRQAVLKSKLGATTKHVLMTLGCHMNEMGESCFPSIETLCEETSLSNRAVITNLKIAEEAGFISTSKHGFAGKRWARNEYKATFPRVENAINLDIKAVNEVHNLEIKAVNLMTKGSEPNDIKAVNEVHTSNSNNYSINNNTAREEKSVPPENLFAFEILRKGVVVTKTGIKKTSSGYWQLPSGMPSKSFTSSFIHLTVLKWFQDKIPLELIFNCITLARLNKPEPESIQPNYLDAIIRNELKPKVDNSWLMTDEGVIAKGREVGIDARAGESMSDYRQRLRNALGIGIREAA